METIFFSETSINIYWTIWSYIPEGRIVHSHRCENLRSSEMTCLFRKFLGQIM
jgi:hypothetical protein